jgi:hypothetical protein
MAPDIADTIWLCGRQIHIHSKSTNIVTADEFRGHFETPVYALCPAYEISCDMMGSGGGGWRLWRSLYYATVTIL